MYRLLRKKKNVKSLSTTSIVSCVLISGKKAPLLQGLYFCFQRKLSDQITHLFKQREVRLIGQHIFFSRHVERCWGASGDFWQGCWMKVHSFFGGSSFLLVVVGK